MKEGKNNEIVEKIIAYSKEIHLLSYQKIFKRRTSVVYQ